MSLDWYWIILHIDVNSHIVFNILAFFDHLSSYIKQITELHIIFIYSYCIPSGIWLSADITGKLVFIPGAIESDMIAPHDNHRVAM